MAAADVEIPNKVSENSQENLQEAFNAVFKPSAAIYF